MLLRRVLDAGGSIHSLVIPASDSGGTGLMNPSPLVWRGRLIMNLRQTNYILYHTEGAKTFNNRWGPLTYLHPEDDLTLRTRNFMCELDPKTLTVLRYTEVDSTLFDKAPLWTFVGLEDARLMEWDGVLGMCGVRRDTTGHGEGRMEFSTIEIDEENWVVREVDRWRIPAPGANDSYCEKNWMPILDMPWHWVKWTNPTEIVRANRSTLGCEQVLHKIHRYVSQSDMRGGSQVVCWGEYRIAVIHEVNLWKNYLEQKDGAYAHRFVVWDQDWNLVGVSPERWSFMSGDIEFCSGAVVWENDLLLTFGFQDNSAHLLRVPADMVDKMVAEAVAHVSA